VKTAEVRQKARGLGGGRGGFALRKARPKHRVQGCAGGPRGKRGMGLSGRGERSLFIGGRRLWVLKVQKRLKGKGQWVKGNGERGERPQTQSWCRHSKNGGGWVF